MYSIVVGTRPEIIKMSSIVLRMLQEDIDFLICQSSQHYDYELSGVFFDELGLPKPERTVKVMENTHGAQIGAIIEGFCEMFHRDKPEYVLVEGDTNTALAGAIAGFKCGIPVAHVEAGLRSHDLRMPEEHNRIFIDHISWYLFPPTRTDFHNLLDEHVKGIMTVAGNTVIDAVENYLPIALDRSIVLNKIPFDRFILATIHRQENVNDDAFIHNLDKVLGSAPFPVVFPLHPRTRERLREVGKLDLIGLSKNVHFLGPLGYFDFLTLLNSCEFVLTDSGGIQEEITAPSLQKRAVVMRKKTDRPETIASGHCVMGGVEYDGVSNAMRKVASNPNLEKATHPYGTGSSAKVIVRHLQDDLQDIDSR